MKYITGGGRVFHAGEMLFICWTRETRVISAALAGLLAAMEALGSRMIAPVRFIAVLMTIIIHVRTTKWLAGRLGLLIETPGK